MLRLGSDKQFSTSFLYESVFVMIGCCVFYAELSHLTKSYFCAILERVRLGLVRLVDR